jgi:hypothetical protein
LALGALLGACGGAPSSDESSASSIGGGNRGGASSSGGSSNSGSSTSSGGLSIGGSTGAIGGGSGASDTTTGIWNRVESQFGYETDVAYGGIKGQPADRVYMCEWNSPSAGLYKGTLVDNSLIQWDSEYRLPDYEVVFLGGGRMTFVPQTGSNELLGKFAHGQWRTGSCDLEFKDGELVDTSRYAYVYAPTLHGVRLNSVTIGGVRMPITSTDASGCSLAVKLPFTQGLYQLPMEFSYSGEGVNGPYTRTEQSAISKDSLVEGCNRLVPNDEQCSRALCVGVLNGPLPERAVVEDVPLPLPTGDAMSFDVDDAALYTLADDYASQYIYRCALDGCASGAERLLGNCCASTCPSGTTCDKTIQYDSIHVHGTRLFSTNIRSTPEKLTTCDISTGKCVMKPFFTPPATEGLGTIAVANDRVYWIEFIGEQYDSPGGSKFSKKILACPVTGCPSGGPTVVYDGTLLDYGYAFNFVLSASAAYVYKGHNDELFELPLLNPDQVDAANSKQIAQLADAQAFNLDGSRLRFCSSGGLGKILSCTPPECSAPATLVTDMRVNEIRTNTTHVYALSGNDAIRFAKTN